MGGKRMSTEKEEKIKRKIRKLEEKLKKKSYKRCIIESSDSDDDVSDEQRMRSATPCSDSPPRPIYSPLTAASSPDPEPSTSRVFQAAPELTLVEPIPSTSKEPVPSTSTSFQANTNDDLELQDDILLLLGDAPKNDVPFGKPIHKDIANRWQEILAKGLSKDVKAKILEEYPIPGNCDLLVAPLLNPEAKAAIPETYVKRDFSLMLKQKQIGIAISALGQATELVINNETSAQKILKPISDACRLLCDTHYNDSKTRRNFVTSSTNLNLKDTLIESVRDKYLFGENMSERLKAAKSVQQSGESLKTKKQSGFFNKNPVPVRNNVNNNHLNSKPFYRKTRNRPAADQEVVRSARTTSIRQRRTRGNHSPYRTTEASHSRPTRSAYRK